MELLFIINIYKDKNKESDIEVSYSFENAKEVLHSYNKFVEKANNNYLVELAVELKDGITGTVYSILTNC